jgi:hypothetical protein
MQRSRHAGLRFSVIYAGGTSYVRKFSHSMEALDAGHDTVYMHWTAGNTLNGAKHKIQHNPIVVLGF